MSSTNKFLHWTTLSSLLLTASLMASGAVAGNGSGAGNGPGAGPGPANGGRPGNGIIPAELSAPEISGIMFMREEEKLARDTYILLFDYWGAAVFSNIASSEQRHMDAVKKLITAFELVDPVTDESDLGTFVDTDLQLLFDTLLDQGEGSLMAALHVGAIIEETDMIDIQNWIEQTKNKDIIATYESLMCGSRNHLRAFVGQIELSGIVYEPSLLTIGELEAIVDDPVERDCGQGNKKGNR